MDIKSCSVAQPWQNIHNMQNTQNQFRGNDRLNLATKHILRLFGYYTRLITLLYNLNSSCTSSLSCIFIHELFHLSLGLAQAVLANSHSASNISLGHDANG